jgi:ABC-type uncharacterized transport system substrate-binding protein
LMSYGVNIDDTYRVLASYVAQLLKGAKVADLPVVQANSFDLVVNLRTAKALGLVVPASLMAIATELVE